MPFVSSTYKSWVGSGHVATIFPNLFRVVRLQKPRKEEISTPDDDFLELDWYDNIPSEKLVILLHGLEGNARRRYIKGMAKYFYERGYHVLAWNYRSCGSRPNRQLRFYHSGDTEDIRTVVNHVLALERHNSISLIGFSMGGNIVLKYLGEEGDTCSPKIKGAATFSVPLDLVGSSKVLSRWWNALYLRRFLKSLKKKIEQKAIFYPNHLSLDGFEEIRSFKGFDNAYTAPLHGFKDAMDYWTRSSSLYYLEKIAVPTLIINAQNDSFLSPSCFPYDIAKKHPKVYLETPKGGGHVGFGFFRSPFWLEKRAYHFLDSFV
jgi:uncharacterized protein